jgi:prepilin-type N-terminal cleavage/methylation domain-containing protein
MKKHLYSTRRGVTLTELLVVVTIIGILSTIAVPVYLNYAEGARKNAARQEVREIANAEDNCALEHGYYVPLQVLDDLPGRAGDNGLDFTADTIQGYSSGVVVAIDYTIPVDDMLGLINQPEITNDLGNDNRVIRMVNTWKGPFLNPQRVNDNSPLDPFNLNKEDYLLDPWGNPYLFYGPAGVLGVNDPTPPYTDSQFSGRFSADDRRFDRWAILSMGPNGIADDTGSNVYDDIFHTFGIVVSETAFSNSFPRN